MEERFCKRKLEIGDLVALRWLRFYCNDCDEKHPTPPLAVYVMGTINQKTLDQFPGLRCGDAGVSVSLDHRAAVYRKGE